MVREESGAWCWAEETFGQCELGDVRRTKRVVQLAASLAQHAGGSVLHACRGDSAATEGGYRLIRNGSVAPEALAEGGFKATVRAATGMECLLAVEDTTELAYEHAVAESLGDLGGREKSRKRGYLVHSTLLLDAASEATVGLIAQERWQRSSAARGQRHQRRERPYGEKESFKWQRASEQMAARLGAEMMARVVSVCDREADIYEYLQHKCNHGERFVVRASWDRRVAHETGRLFAALAEAPLLGEQEVNIAQRGGRHGRGARCARVALRAGRVTLAAPRRDKRLPALTLWAVRAEEVDPPAGVEPLHWLLLTSEPVERFSQTQFVVRAYPLRWRVEEFHKAWKSGAKVEQQRLQSPENLERMAVLLAFVAVRLLQLREAVQGLPQDTADPERPCTEVLNAAEWRILWVTQERSRPPQQPPSLSWAYHALAHLGGWLDTKRTGRVGWQTLWKGWFRLQERVDAYLASQDLLSQ